MNINYKKLIILKVGGSVLTNKNNLKIEENKDIISNIAFEIKKHIGKLILVHGAGSFGHILAKKYNSNTNNFFNYYEIHSSVLRLNNTIIDIFHKKKINAIGISPFLISVSKNGRINSMYTKQIIEMLSKKIVPVLHGDISIDKNEKITIISGDQIVSYLSKKLHIQKLGFGSNTDGVLDIKKNTIPTITPDNIKNY